MQKQSVVVLGGGLSGIGAAYTLARAGVQDITIIERSNSLGGLAGSFEREGHFYPLGYHHILHRDRPLLFFLQQIDALADVRWRKIRMLFQLDGECYDLGSPGGFLRFPMPVSDKLRFVRMMLRAFGKADWSDWEDRSAAELVDTWAGAGVRTALFERLTRLKFELPTEQVSGAWLGARLHFREGSAPLGYIPEVNWTKVLCDGLTRLLEDHGIRIRMRTSVARLHTDGERIREAELSDGDRIGGDVFVSSIPTETYLTLVPGDATPHLDSIRYSALISVVCATEQRVEPEFYWMNLASLKHTAGGIFLLSSLNPSIGKPGDSCVNFVTHLNNRTRPLFQLPDDQLLARYFEDFRAVFGFDLQPFWSNVARVPMYSPVFTPNFHNPPVRSATWGNLYFAGNYRTFPSIVSTGTALWSGVEAGEAILRHRGESRTDLPAAIRGFRLRSMPKA
jgi:protoporphyrinogen oxidase